jgi:hypothetical protein
MEPCYGKLVADNGREYFIQVYDGGIKFEIGREKKPLTDPCYFNLAETNTLSKKHAEIFWDIDRQGFFMKNLSKNKILVEDEEVAMGQISRKLENMTAVMIAKIKFYFLLPIDSN